MITSSDTAERLKTYLQRVERLLDEIDGLKGDVKDLETEIKSQGFNIKAFKKLVSIRRKDSSVQEAELLNDLLLYASVTGTQLELALQEPDDTPLERAINNTKVA